MSASKQAWEQPGGPDGTRIPLRISQGRGSSATAATKVSQERQSFPGCARAAGECLSVVGYISSDLLPRGSWLIVYQNQLLPPVALLPLSAPMSCKLQAEADLREGEAESAHVARTVFHSSLCLPGLG